MRSTLHLAASPVNPGPTQSTRIQPGDAYARRHRLERWQYGAHYGARHAFSISRPDADPDLDSPRVPRPSRVSKTRCQAPDLHGTLGVSGSVDVVFLDVAKGCIVILDHRKDLIQTEARQHPDDPVGRLAEHKVTAHVRQAAMEFDEVPKQEGRRDSSPTLRDTVPGTLSPCPACETVPRDGAWHRVAPSGRGPASSHRRGSARGPGARPGGTDRSHARDSGDHGYGGDEDPNDGKHVSHASWRISLRSRTGHAAASASIRASSQ